MAARFWQRGPDPPWSIGLPVDLARLRQLPPLRELDEAALRPLVARAATRLVPRDSAVFEQGARARSFYLLVEGRLKVTQITADGQQVMLRLVHPGDLFGLARAISRRDYPATARAAVDCIALAWPTAEWDTILAENPRFALFAIRTIGRRLDDAHTRLREMATQEAGRRIAHTVLRMAERAGRPEEGGIRIDFPVSRQDIAEMTATTLHTVSRTISAWEGRGLVRGGRRRLTLIDGPGLRRIADPDM